MLGILNDKQRVAVIGIFFATLLCFFGLANSYWSTFTMYSKAEQREISYRMGLWQVCQEVSSFKDCKTLGFLTTTSAHNVIRMCAVVCLMLGILSVVAVFDTVYEHHTQNTYITAVTAFVGAQYVKRKYRKKTKKTAPCTPTEEMLVNNDACEKFSLGGAIVAFVMTLTGVAGPHWMYVTGLRNSNNMGNFSVRLGLWLKCTYPPDVEECQYHPFFEVLGMYRLSRVCATLSTGLCLCAAIGTITKTFVSRHVRMRDIGIACTFAGGLGMATISVFLCKVDDLVEIPNSKKSVTYGWSFFIFSVGALIATFTAYVVFLTYPDAGRTLSRFAVPEYFILDSAMLRSGTFPPGTYAVQCDYDPTKQPEMVPYATSVMLPDDQGGCDPKKLAEPVAVQRKYA